MSFARALGQKLATEKIPALLHFLHFGFSINGLGSADSFLAALGASTERNKDPR
jgi:hypothetical protein